MAASKLVLALLLVAVAQCGTLTKDAWDAEKASLISEESEFVKANQELKPAFQYLMDVWGAGAKYECAIEGKNAPECKALKDTVRYWAKLINGGTPSAGDTSTLLDESDSMLEDANVGVALNEALMAAIKKKQGAAAQPLLDLFNKFEKDSGISM